MINYFFLAVSVLSFVTSLFIAEDPIVKATTLIVGFVCLAAHEILSLLRKQQIKVYISESLIDEFIKTRNKETH